MLRRTCQCLLAIGRLQYFVAVPGQPRDKDFPVGLIVIDDEDARWRVHLEPVTAKLPDFGEKLPRNVGFRDESVATPALALLSPPLKA
jgi:hypothetical protein